MLPVQARVTSLVGIYHCAIISVCQEIDPVEIPCSGIKKLKLMVKT